MLLMKNSQLDPANVQILSERHIIVHAHIFKNAGTTLDWILNKNFASSFREDQHDAEMARDNCYFTQLLDFHSDLKAISSDSISLPIQQQAGFVFHTLVMIRNPLERIRSVYNFERQQDAGTPGDLHAKKYNFRKYVEWRIRPDVAPTIRNMHVRYLTKSMLPESASLTKVHLKAALSSIKANPYLGVVDLFDKSIELWAQRFHENGIEIDFKYKKQNVSSSKKAKATDKLQELEEDLESDLFDAVICQNAFDIQVYQMARSLIIHRFSLLQQQANLGVDQEKGFFCSPAGIL
jgi:hypothetical protein